MSERTCPKGHIYYKTSDCPTCPTCMSNEMREKYGQEFPKIGNPALSALDHAGITKFANLTNFTEKDLLNLHGFGPKALSILKAALQEKGLSFKK